VAGHRDACLLDTVRDERRAHGLRAAPRELDVVLVLSDVVREALDGHLATLGCDQEPRHAGDRHLRLGLELVAVELEEHTAEGHQQPALGLLRLECSGAPHALATAGLSVQPEGTICVIATYPALVPFEATAFTRTGQTMVGVMGSSREDFENAMVLIERGIFPVDAYSQVYPFDRVLDAMDDSMAARTTKAVLAVNTST